MGFVVFALLRGRAEEVEEGPVEEDMREVSWAVKSRELERAMLPFRFLGGGCP
jgi:hypothetical protein